MSKGRNRKGRFLERVDIEQRVDLVVDEAGEKLGGKTERSADRQQVCETGAVVPAEVAIGSRAIFPRVAPIGARADNDERRVCHRWIAGRGVDQNLTIVPRAELAQSKLCGAEVVDACRKIRKIAADQVELDFVQRARASCSTEESLSARKFLALGDARREEQQLRDCVEARQNLFLGSDAWGGDGGECCHAGLLKVFREARYFEGRVDLEEKRLVFPVEKVRMHPEAQVRMLGAIVIFPGRVDVAVRHEWDIVDGEAAALCG